MTDHDRAQLAALGARCARCGTPAHPRGGHGYTSAGYTCPPQDDVAVLRAALHEAVGLLEQLDAYHPAENCDSCAMIRAALNREARPSGAEMERDALREELARVTAERDALRGALEVELERACDTTTRYTLERVLATTGGDR